MNGACNSKKKWPHPWSHGEGSKGQISLNFNIMSIFKIFIPKFVCVLTIKDMKHIKQDFVLTPGSYLRGGTPEVKKKISNMVMLCGISNGQG